MDAATLAAGLASSLTDFTTEYGPIILTVVGIAVGLYGLVFAWSFVKRMIRAREARS